MGNNINKNKILGRKLFGIIPSIITSYDPDFQLVIDAIQSTGVTLTTTEKNAGNTLVISCKNNGAWTNSLAFYGILGGTSGAHKWNWKNPLNTNAAFRLNFTTGWVHNANGMTPNGVSSYAQTFLNGITSLNSNNSHISFYSRTNSDNIGQDFGNIGNAFGSITRSGNSLISDFLGNGSQFVASPDRLQPANTSSNAFFIFSSTSTNIKIYKNNTTLVSKGSATSSGYPNTEILLSYGTTSGANRYSNRQLAFSSIGNGLTDLQATNFYNSIQAYQTALGRQV